MLRTTRVFGSAVFGLLLGATACENDELVRPANLIPADPLFERYVAMGNSITAGFQSGGINDSTQVQSYAVLLAGRMQTPFFVPLMNRPGCPAPFTNVFTGARVLPVVPGGCALRKTQKAPPPFISNVAVPGAEVMDAISNLSPTSNANALTVFFLGGLTQTQMMRRARPRFMTVWIGNNDVLGAATNGTNGGDSTLITPLSTFQANYTAMADSIEDVGPWAVVLIGVANVTAIPFFSQGQAYFAAKAGGSLPANFLVGPSCAPRALGGIGDSVYVPFPFGGALLAASAGGPVTLNCTEPQTIQPAELRRLVADVTAYNTAISGVAAGRGWAYFNPNPTLDSLRTVATAVRPFPLFNQACTANPFGTAFSCDAVHPSAATHRLLANKLIQLINSTYGTRMLAIP